MCPSVTCSNVAFTLTPAPEVSSAGCYLSLGPIGYTVYGSGTYYITTYIVTTLYLLLLTSSQDIYFQSLTPVILISS